MEDLIEIKSKKEQSMTDLEKLKSEIMKNKTFLESLKKTNLNEDAQRIKPSTTGNEGLRNTENKTTLTPVLEGQERNLTSPKPLQRSPQSHQVIDNHLPDLVNHEKFVIKDEQFQQQVVPDHLQHLNLSQDYLKHLQRIQEFSDSNLHLWLNGSGHPQDRHVW